MPNRSAISPLAICVSLLALGATSTASYGQASLAVPRVLGPVNESRTAQIRGNTLPLARAQFDRGPVADNAPTGHMLVLLRRSDAQQKALNQLIAEQKDPKSLNYHKWLTPEQFGERFVRRRGTQIHERDGRQERWS